MCILSDREISSLVSRRLLIAENYDSASLTPNGYDLRIESIKLGDGDAPPSGELEIPPGRWFAVSSMEKVSLPGDITGQLWIRSTYARRGVMTSFGKVDAGFMGVLTLGGFNASSRPLKLEKGTRFVQLVFERMCTGSHQSYAERSGNYQGQDRLTLEPIRNASHSTSGDISPARESSS